MNGTLDTHDSATAGEGELDPRDAATLLEQTRRQAQQRFALTPPATTLLWAATALVAFGAVWLSVRGQHPYKGPTGAAIGFLYAVVLISAGIRVRIAARALSGRSGPSIRQQRIQGVAGVTVLISIYVFMGALLHDGASHAIVYGIYPATAPLIILGGFGAAVASGRQEWTALGLALALVLVGAGSAFAGPRTVWLSSGIGCCVALTGYSLIRIRLQRATR